MRGGGGGLLGRHVNGCDCCRVPVDGLIMGAAWVHLELSCGQTKKERNRKGRALREEDYIGFWELVSEAVKLLPLLPTESFQHCYLFSGNLDWPHASIIHIVATILMGAAIP